VGQALVLLSRALDTFLAGGLKFAVVFVLSCSISLEMRQLFVLEGGHGRPCELLFLYLHTSEGLLRNCNCLAFGRSAPQLISLQLAWLLLLSKLVLLWLSFEMLFEPFLDVVDEIVEHFVLNFFLQILLLLPIFQLQLLMPATFPGVISGFGCEDGLGVDLVCVVAVGRVMGMGVPFHPMVVVVAFEVDPVESTHSVHFVIFIYISNV